MSIRWAFSFEERVDFLTVVTSGEIRLLLLINLTGDPLPSTDWLIADTFDVLSPPSPGIPFARFLNHMPTQAVQVLQWAAVLATFRRGWPIACWASEPPTRRRRASQKSKGQVSKGKTSERQSLDDEGCRHPNFMPWTNFRHLNSCPTVQIYTEHEVVCMLLLNIIFFSKNQHRANQERDLGRILRTLSSSL